VGLPGDVTDTVPEHSVDPDSMLEVFSSPSTLPHLLAMVVSCGFLYVVMGTDISWFEIQGAVIFLSLSITYSIAAVVAPSKLGGLIFKITHYEEGVLNRNYWVDGFYKLLPILLISGAIWFFSNYTFQDSQLNNVRYFLAMLFIAMSVFQGISLTFGGVVYGRKKQKKPRASKVGGIFSIIRSGGAVLILIPPIWWFGYGGVHPSDTKFSANIVWLLFLITVVFLGVALDHYTKKARERDGVDGAALDKAFFLIFITACWHLLGAWRRSPWTAEQSSAGMLIEEGALMSISIFLAVWSMSKKGNSEGWRIFQGQSAIFWGISFGFAYAGSIASLTALSEGSLMTTTAIGHAITALVMIAILPMSITLIGKPDILQENQYIEASKDDNVIPENDLSDLTDRFAEEEDLVELVD